VSAGPARAWFVCALAAAVALAAGGRATAQPSDIHVYEMAGASKAVRIAMATLMGNVNRDVPEMYMAYQQGSAPSNPRIWLDRYVATQPATQVHWNASPGQFLERYRDRLAGYVLYDDAGLHVNEATSVAGVLQAVAITPALESLAIAAGLTKVEDVRGRDTASIYAQYGAQFNRESVFSLDLFHGHELRDLAVQQQALMYWNPPAKAAYLQTQNDHTQVYGWDVTEQEFFGSASAHNLKAVAANYSQGYSALSKWNVEIPRQQTHAASDAEIVDGKHYVAFVMSDGDNAQWLTNGFVDDPRWFGSPHRGNFTMNWDLTPDMARLAPIVVKHLYEQASQGSAQDYFVTAHGPGTDYPSDTPDYAGSLAATAASMQAVDHRVLSVLDNAWNTDRFDEILADDRIVGGMFKSNWGAGYAAMNGQIYWHAGKPMVAVKHSLWDGFGTAASISAALNAAPRDPLGDQRSYSVVNVHPWSTGGLGDPMSNLQDLVNRLDPAVQVVTLDELLLHLRNQFGAPTAPAPRQLLGNGSFETGTNGWFQSANPYEGLYPIDASDGTQSIGFTTVVPSSINVPSTWADWRSASMEVEPGDEVVWAFSYRIDEDAVGDVLAELRGFADASLASFVGEDWATLSSTDGAWRRVTRRYVVPSGVTALDLRFSNIFTNRVRPFAGSFRLDDVAIVADGSPADFDGDGDVDQRDVALWEVGVGLQQEAWQSDGDADADGVVDGADLLVWQRAYGTTAIALGAVVAIPEPHAAALCGVALVISLSRCSAPRQGILPALMRR
jgi:hypothetical protein